MIPVVSAIGIPVALSLLFGAGFVANEWSHGGMAEIVGLGHRHMLDVGGYHCSPHDDPAQGEQHVHHMHPNGSAVPHGDCPGVHASGHPGGM